MLDAGFRAKLAKKKHISKYDFSLLFQKLGLHDGAFVDRLYIAAHQHSSGEIRPQDIITSVALLVPDQQDELLSLLFDLWDRDATGSLSAEEFCEFYQCVRRKDPNSYSLLVSSSEKEPFKPEHLVRQATETFQQVDVDSDGKIDKKEFLAALSAGNPLHLDDAFFERVRDPTRCGQLFAPYTLAQRTLLKLLGKKQVYFENEELPQSVHGEEGKYDVFYVVLSGQVQSSCVEDDEHHKPSVLGPFDYINEESLLVSKSFRYRLLKRARALTDVLVLQIPTREFRLAYMEREAGAESIMLKLREGMEASLEVEEKSPSANVRRFAAIKRTWLYGSDKVLEESNLRRSLVDMEYAVRGLVPTTAERIQQELKSGEHKKPFDEILWANIGNPHSVGQKPVTFYREVLAAVDCPSMLERAGIEKILPADVIERAKWLSSKIKGGTGAYSHSQASFVSLSPL